MNAKRLILSILAVAAVLWVFDFIYHGMILGSQYKATAESWRPDEEMMKWYPLGILGYFVISIAFCVIWAMGFAAHGHGLKCGAIYGVFMGMTGGGGMLLSFVFTPIPTFFMAPWIIASLLSGALAGLTVACVYKPRGGAAGAAEAAEADAA